MRLLAMLAVAALLLAGCSGDGPSSSTAPGTGRGTATGTSTATSSDDDGAEGIFLVTVDGPLDVGVPLPHLDRCMAPQDWAAGAATAVNATWRLLTVNRGTLLQVTATGPAIVHLKADLSGKPKCQTLRYDPWSIDPDPADGTVEVQAGQGSAHMAVVVHVVDGRCTTVTAYNGTVATPGWHTLASGTGTASHCA
ncbi:MAG: hypothetical protein QOD77_1687 [Thermoplasmata archaeon]|jgi:hypothetical protein|nr:hypothetical protein [Thermoplasmata archaeon]